MIHINRNSAVPKAFRSTPITNDIKKYQFFFKRSVKSRSQEGFNESINGDTKETRQAVAEQFKYKCAACEQSLSINNVVCDSWRPRHNAKGLEEEFAQDHYWWLAYVWNNKYALCANCNKFKGTLFPVEGRRAPINTPYSSIIKTENALLIDPCHDYPEEHFFMQEDGKLLYLTKKGEVTIEVLKLNRKELLNARKMTIVSVSNTLEAAKKFWPGPESSPKSSTREKSELKKIHELYSLISGWLKDHPEEDFVMLRRQMVVSWLYGKPDYHNVQAFKNFFSGCKQSPLFKEMEAILRNFQLVLSKKPGIILNFKPSAIIKPDTSLRLKKIPRKISKKITPAPVKKPAREVPDGKKPGALPVNTLSTLIERGLKVANFIYTDPFIAAIAKGAANLFKEVFDEKKLVRLYPEKIEIKNFKSISNLNFDFKIPTPETKLLGTSVMSHKEPWKFLLGENGVGKSSILQAISLVLSGEAYLKSLKLDPSDLLRHGTKSGTVKIWFVGVNEPAILSITPGEMSCNFETGRVNVLGYGSTRVMPKENTSLQPEESNSSAKIKNLFDYSVSLSDVKNWLITIDQKSFDQVARALKDVLDLPSAHTYFIRENDKVYFSRHKETLDQLSEGYRSVIALAVDIMKTLSEDNKETGLKKSGTLLTYDVMEGIVLIDEISSHLHPRWQMKIVKAFRKAFPKLQFIVTSHDPLSLKGIEQGEVLLLKKDQLDNVIGIGNLPDPTELRAEQLLTSEFFGLSSTLDPDLETLFNTYHYLLAKQQLTPEETQQLAGLKKSLKDKRHLGDTLREELMYNVIDTSLARYADNIENIDREVLFDDTKTQVLNLWDKLYK